MKRPAMPAGGSDYGGAAGELCVKGEGRVPVGTLREECIFEADDGASRIQKMTP